MSEDATNIDTAISHTAQDVSLWTNSFLNEFWQDMFSAAGLLGTAATLVALVVAIKQLRKSKSAFEAAAEAAKSESDLAKQNYADYVVSNAKMYLRELELHVAGAKWARASSRANDLADMFAQITVGADDPAKDELRLVTSTRGWVQTFSLIESGELDWDDGLRKKWASQVRSCYSTVDGKFGPFKSEVANGDTE